MNYIEQLNYFYDLLQCNLLSSTAQLLYHTLLMINNKCGWIEWFQRTNMGICNLMNISENTLKKARNELKQLNLIDFKQAEKKGQITKYKIIMVSRATQYIDTIPDTITDTIADTITDTQADDIYKHKPKLKNIRNIKEKNRKIKSDEKEYGEFKNVFLTDIEFNKLINIYGNKAILNLIEELSCYIKTKNRYDYQDFYATLRTFARRNNLQEIKQNEDSDNDFINKNREKMRKLGD